MSAGVKQSHILRLLLCTEPVANGARQSSRVAAIPYKVEDNSNFSWLNSESVMFLYKQFGVAEQKYENVISH